MTRAGSPVDGITRQIEAGEARGVVIDLPVVGQLYLFRKASLMVAVEARRTTRTALS